MSAMQSLRHKVVTSKDNDGIVEIIDQTNVEELSKNLATLVSERESLSRQMKEGMTNFLEQNKFQLNSKYKYCQVNVTHSEVSITQ